jgi:ribosomal protein S18 acetylase RimI-like enzyme
LNIRPANGTDISALVHLMQAVQSLHAEAHPDLFVAELDDGGGKTFFEQLLASPRNLVLVAEISGTVVGYIWCEERGGSQGFHRKDLRSAYIHHISVDPDHLRQGIGKALVEGATVEMKARGAAGIGVDYWTFNDRARAFFTDLGFRPQREVLSKRLT